MKAHILILMSVPVWVNLKTRVFCLALLLAGCNAGQDATRASSERKRTGSEEIRTADLWLPSAPVSTDPRESVYIANEMAYRSVHAPLVSRGRLGHYMGLVASSWSASADKRIWKFTLRSDLPAGGPELLAEAAVRTFQRLLFLSQRDPGGDDFTAMVQGAGRQRRADDPVSGIRISGSGELTLELREGNPRLLDLLSGSLYGIVLPEEFDPRSGEWRNQGAALDSTGAYRLKRLDEHRLELRLKKDYPPALLAAKPLQRIVVSWGPGEDKSRSSLALGHSNARDLEATHEFVGGPMSGVTYIRCHSWKRAESLCGNLKSASQMRNQFYREFENSGLPLEPEFFPDAESRMRYRAELGRMPPVPDRQVDSKPQGLFRVMQAGSKLSPYFKAAIDAFERLRTGKSFPIQVVPLKATQIVHEKKPDLPSYLVDVSIRASDVDFGAIREELRVLWLNPDGLMLPDRSGDIVRLLERYEGAKTLRAINEKIWEEAAIWPLAHFSQGLHFRLGEFETSAFNPMQAPGEYQWIGWRN